MKYPILGKIKRFFMMTLGALIYASYGYRKNRLAEKKEIVENE